MGRLVCRTAGKTLTLGIVGAALLAWGSPASAQTQQTQGGTRTSTGGSGISGGSAGGSFGGSSGGSFGGSSGGSFSGNSGSGSSGSGQGFTGGQSSFSGGGSFVGTTSSGSAGSTIQSSTIPGVSSSTGRSTNSFRPGAGGTSFPTPGQSNPFVSYYNNPMAMGMPGGTGRTGFGTPIYQNLMNTSGLTSGTTAGITGGVGASGSSNSSVSGSSMGVRRAPAYTTTLGFSRDAPVSNALHADLKGVLARSSRLTTKDGIDLAVDGDVVILRGTVGNDHDRRLAEGLVRLTPGVHEVRNELLVGNSRELAPLPKRVP